MMDYRTFFQDTDRLSGDDYICTIFRDAGSLTRIGTGRYPVLFILQGAIDLHFQLQHTSIQSGNLIVIDNTKLLKCMYSADTVLLVYNSPAPLEMFFGYCCTAFLSAYSNSVHILPPVKTWIEALLTTHIHNSQSDETRHTLRKNLSKALLSTPRGMLGELHVAFSSCAAGNCERCAVAKNEPAVYENQGGGKL